MPLLLARLLSESSDEPGIRKVCVIVTTTALLIVIYGETISPTAAETQWEKGILITSQFRNYIAQLKIWFIYKLIRIRI